MYTSSVPSRRHVISKKLPVRSYIQRLPAVAWISFHPKRLHRTLPNLSCFCPLSTPDLSRRPDASSVLLPPPPLLPRGAPPLPPYWPSYTTPPRSWRRCLVPPTLRLGAIDAAAWRNQCRRTVAPPSPSWLRDVPHLFQQRRSTPSFPALSTRRLAAAVSMSFIFACPALFASTIASISNVSCT